MNTARLRQDHRQYRQGRTPEVAEPERIEVAVRPALSDGVTHTYPAVIGHFDPEALRIALFRQRRRRAKGMIDGVLKYRAVKSAYKSCMARITEDADLA